MIQVFIRTHVITVELSDWTERSNQGPANASPLLAVSSPMYVSELPVSIDYRESVWMGSWIFSPSELR